MPSRPDARIAAPPPVVHSACGAPGHSPADTPPTRGTTWPYRPPLALDDLQEPGSWPGPG